MNSELKTIDVDDACNILRSDELWKKQLEQCTSHPQRKDTIYLLCVLSLVESIIPNKLCGIHSTVTNEKVNRQSYDYCFDFRNDKGNLILPFTQEKPLIILIVSYTDVYEVLPELKNCHTFKAGVYCGEYREKLFNQISRRTDVFPEFALGYGGGQLIKITPDDNYDIRKKFLNLIYPKPKGVILEEKVDKLQKDYEKLREELDDMWKPEGVLSRIMEWKFSEDANKL